jgi:hypothetical protein
MEIRVMMLPMPPESPRVRKLRETYDVRKKEVEGRQGWYWVRWEATDGNLIYSLDNREEIQATNDPIAMRCAVEACRESFERLIGFIKQEERGT